MDVEVGDISCRSMKNLLSCMKVHIIIATGIGNILKNLKELQVWIPITTDLRYWNPINPKSRKQLWVRLCSFQEMQ
jgi:hypothetical protein